MASKKAQLAALLRSAREGLDKYRNAIVTIQNGDWGDELAEHHLFNFQDGLRRVDQERAYVHDTLHDPKGKNDL